MLNTKEEIKENGLVYVTDTTPGIYRKSKKGNFYYQDKNGNEIIDDKDLQRIKSLVLPPAWKNVWIAISPNAYLQATGIDAAHRKQYRYHHKWIALRSDTKYFRLLAFGKALPEARKRITKDLSRKNLDEQKVLAICVDLLQKTLLRVGAKSYLQQYGSIGLSTLRDKHVKTKENSLKLSFVGKKGVKHEVALTDSRLVRLVKKCKDIPGQELFQFYSPDGIHKSIDSGQINSYIKEITKSDFTAKDFRTWGGTLAALRQFAICEKQPERISKMKTETRVLDEVAKKLGNTRAVCKSAYIYPLLFEAFENDWLNKWLKRIDMKSTATVLQNDESVLLTFLRSCEKRK